MFKKQKIGGKTYWRRELGNATLGDGEGLDIYGMRLVEIAELAYPDSKSEAARHLREHYLKSMVNLILVNSQLTNII